MSVDWREFQELARDLGAVPETAGKNIRQAVEVTARKTKDHWRDGAKGMAHAPGHPFSVSYDMKGFEGFGASVVSAEIGPDKSGPQGALGNLIEFGSRNNPPQGIGQAALHANEEDFARGLDIALRDAEEANGL